MHRSLFPLAAFSLLPLTLRLPRDLVSMRICYKAIDTSVISCPSTFLPLPLCYDMGIEFWSVIPWAMSGWHFAWWQMGYGHGSCTVSTKSENLNLMWKGETEDRGEKEGRRRRSVNERRPIFSHRYPSFPLLASVNNKTILRNTDGAVKQCIITFNVNVPSSM